MTSRLLRHVDPLLRSKLVQAARDTSHVSGLTHNFYRYPARFSPKFVRAAIEAFSDPMDVVFDPFMGGGTTLVEAMSLGRHSVGADISSLASFLSDVKTTIYSDEELRQLQRWVARVSKKIDIHAGALVSDAYVESRYLKHLDHPKRWRIRKAIAQSITTIEELRNGKIEKFARCVVLRTAQWALDGRKRVPSIDDFRAMLLSNAKLMFSGATDLRSSARNSAGRANLIVRCLNRSTCGIDADPRLRRIPKPKLVLTSPPYPGVHVLYHRWQVDGRKETAAPFWIANKLDGSGASYYTMGDRHAPELNPYFEMLRNTMKSVSALCNRESTIVQVVAFSKPSWQLPRYLSAVDDAGLTEQFLPELSRCGDGRLWRTVPNRKWHADQKGDTNGSQEVVLFHRLR